MRRRLWALCALVVAGCGERQEPLRTLTEVQRATLVPLPNSTRVLEGETVTTFSHGWGVVAKLSMSKAAYTEFRRSNPLRSYRETTSTDDIPLRLTDRWKLQGLAPESFKVLSDQRETFVFQPNGDTIVVYMLAAN